MIDAVLCNVFPPNNEAAGPVSAVIQNTVSSNYIPEHTLNNLQKNLTAMISNDFPAPALPDKNI